LPFDTPTNTLDVQLFSPFQVNSQDHSPIEFRSNTERALLAYLVVETKHPQTREFLCGFIWPELSEEKAHNNLRFALSHLRQSIKSAGLDLEVIAASGTSIQANAERVNVDAMAFLELIHQTESHDHSSLGNCIICIERLTQATQIFRGEFLQGFNLTNNIYYQEWLVLQREKFNRYAINIFRTLADYHQWHGKLEQVRAYALRQLKLEPWKEEAHRQLMSCFAMQNDKNAALA